MQTHWIHPVVGAWLAILVLAGSGCGTAPSTGGSGDGDGDGDAVATGDGEDGAVDGAPVEVVATRVAEAAIGPEGGTLRNPDNSVTVNVPAGALAATTTLRLEQLLPAAGKADSVAGDAWVVPSRRYRLLPAATTFAKPVWVSVHMPASALPLPATFHDIGLYRYDSGVFSTFAMDPPYGVLMNFPTALWCSGTTDRAGEFAARLHPPYAEAPALVQIGAATAVSTVDGPKVEVQPSGVQSIWGRGFGWDSSKVEVQVGDQTFAVQPGVRNALLQFSLWLPPPAQTTDYPVTVRVAGKSSNTLQLRVAGLSSGKSVVKNITPSGGACVGCRVRLQGTFYGSEKTRRVVIAGVEVPADVDSVGQLWFTVPTVALGGHTLTVIDGLGGPPSDPAAFLVWSKQPPQLSAGAETGGLWLPPPTAGVGSPTLVLDVAGVPPVHNPYSKVQVRYESTAASTAWADVPYTLAGADACAGLPSGLCYLTPPAEVLVGLHAGDTLKVYLRHRQRVMPDDVPPDASMVEQHFEAAPLALAIAGRGLHGATAYAYVGYAGKAWADAPCGVNAGQPFNVHDLLCLRAALACTDTGCSEQQAVSVPGLLPTPIVFAGGSGEPDPRGAWLRCVPLAKAGSFTVSNAGQGSTCPIEVVAAGGQAWTYAVEIGDGSAAIALGAGGARFELPAGALPKLPAGQTYTVDFHQPIVGDTLNPPPTVVDPAAKAKHGAWSLKITPEPAALAKAGSLALPVDPVAGAGKLGLIDTTSGFVHKLAASYDQATGRLVAAIAAGSYQAPTSKPQPGAPTPALPASFNTAHAAIGVTYTSSEPGVLEDDQGRFRVDYITDPSSSHFVDQAYAVAVLQAATDAWAVLAGLGWKLPSGPIALSIRATVSVWSSTAKGATTGGYLGQPWITIKKGLSASDVANVAAHEVGHLFQRQYTTNLKLSWLDEGMAEWVAFQTLGKAGFDTDGLTGDADAVQLVLAGIPDSFGGANSDFIYGAAAWVLFLGAHKGPEAVRKAYEALDWSPEHWISAHKTIESATGQSIGAFARAFAEAFWLQTFEPIDGLTHFAALAKLGLLEEFKPDPSAGGSWPLGTRPAYSSRRYRVALPQSLAAQINVGDVVLRVSGLAVASEVSLWSSALGTDPTKATKLQLLSKDKPFVVLPSLPVGALWVLHNHFTNAAGGQPTFGIELPRITATSSDSVKVGADVWVKGKSFGSKPGTLTVGGQAVAVTWTGWKDDHLSFTMPSFANTAKVSIRVTTAEGAKTNEVFVTIVE